MTEHDTTTLIQRAEQRIARLRDLLEPARRSVGQAAKEYREDTQAEIELLSGLLARIESNDSSYKAMLEHATKLQGNLNAVEVENAALREQMAQFQQALWPDGKRYFLNDKPCAPEAQGLALHKIMHQQDAERIKELEAQVAQLQEAKRMDE